METQKIYFEKFRKKSLLDTWNSARFPLHSSAMFQFRLFQRESYDYKEIFSEHIKQLRALQSRDQLMTGALSSLAQVFAVRGACVLMKESGAGTALMLDAQIGSAPVHYSLAQDSPLLKWFEGHDELLCLDAVTQQHFPRGVDRALKEMIELKAAVLVPLRIDTDLLGIIAMCAPEGRRIFRAEEKELLSIFGFEMAIAIQNAYLYEAVLRQNAQLKELSSLKNNFISNITHELSTPLHNIIGLAQAMGEGSDGAVTEEQKQHLSMIEEAGEKLLKLHQGVLDLSLLERGPGQLHIQKLSIRDLVLELMPWIEGEAARGENTVLNEIPAALPFVYGDEDRVRQVFMKVLDNACRFTEQGSITLRAEKQGEMLRVAVQDSGLGIAPEHHQIIFEPFRQVQGGHDRSYEGPGLGLAVAKKIVEMHGSRIWVESRLGEGTCFYFTIPIRPANIRPLEIK
jgi:signal transduction histidine kinase